ncbi:MAG: ABC transporter ATP-binding protein [Planctomycetes bacterium]|nr:ABC transporter ATP-binding protein [Planctomycetota bacterium]
MLAVETIGLKRRYGNRVALAGLDLSVRGGEVFGLLGPNGSGKSTLVSILATLLPLSEGRASVFGRDVALSPHEVRRSIGVVFQSPSLDRNLTVRENLVHHGHLYGVSGRALRGTVDAALARGGLAERAGERVQTLSGGLARRVEVAKGMLHGPKMLLLDEPSTGLDPAARRDLWTRLKDLRSKEGVTVLVTTHWMEEAERCDRLAILHEGRAVAQGTPAALRGALPFDVVQFRSADPEGLLDAVKGRFGVEGAVQDGAVRLERNGGQEFARQVTSVFGDRIDAVTVGRPTLEDVFVRHTGRGFWEGKA